MSEPRLDIATDSLGRCYFCGMVRPESGMIRHLQACSSRREVFRLPSSPATAASFHLLITPCGSPRIWQHIEVPAHLKMAHLAEWLGHSWPMLSGTMLFINHQEVNLHDPISNLFVPGLIVQYETPRLCLHMQVVSWYDGYSQSDHTFVLMAQSLETPFHQSSN